MSSGQDKHILILGGGVGGLTAAARLARRGLRVTLVEKNERVGGKLNRWIAPHPHRPDGRPFTFDTGPSLLTMPLVFADAFAAAGVDVRDCLQITKLDPISRFVWADGMTFELSSDEAKTLEQVRQISPGDEKGWAKFLRRGKAIWDLSGELFLEHAPEQLFKPGKLSPTQGLSMLTVPLRIGMFSRYSKLVEKHVKHPRLREVLYQYATYSGASPFTAPATLAVIPYVETGLGGWYIEGGMYTLAERLREAGEANGVEFRTGTPVRRILIDPPATPKGKPRVRGVELANGETIEADAVIANSDVVYTYRNLIDERYRPHYPNDKLDHLDPGGSGMVLLLGVDGTYPQLAHHTKFMPLDYRDDLRAMFETRSVPDDPCIYVCASSRTDPTQAPDGCDNLFVLVSAPPLVGEGASLDWEREGQRYRDAVVRRLEETFGLTELSKRIVVEQRWTPRELAGTYNANAGSIYGIGSTSRRSAFLRPPNRDRDVTGLFFAGGATHPGGGLPLVALSGKIAAEMVEQSVQ